MEPAPGVVAAPDLGRAGLGAAAGGARAGPVGGVALGGPRLRPSCARPRPSLAVRSLPDRPGRRRPAADAPRWRRRRRRRSRASAGGRPCVRLGPGRRTRGPSSWPRRRDVCAAASPTPGVLVLAPGHRPAADVARRLRDRGHRHRPAPRRLGPGPGRRMRGRGRTSRGLRPAAAPGGRGRARRPRRGVPRGAGPHVGGMGGGGRAGPARRGAVRAGLAVSHPRDPGARAALVAGPARVERRGWPAVEVVDRRDDDPRTGLFSERLVRAGREP